MDETNGSLIARLQSIGVDTDTAITRFLNNRTLYERCLLKFPLDDSFQRFVCSFKNKDYETALCSVHSLKGTSASFELARLHNACAQMVSYLRSNNIEEAKNFFQELESAYWEVVDIIK